MDVINPNEQRQCGLVGDFDVPIGFKAKCEYVVIPFCMIGKVWGVTDESIGSVSHGTIGELSIYT